MSNSLEIVHLYVVLNHVRPKNDRTRTLLILIELLFYLRFQILLSLVAIKEFREESDIIADDVIFF
jgi:hypothetical protein